MDDTDRQVLAAAREWSAQGRRFALATVVRTWGSSPRPPGAWMALREDGPVCGSVSGGCIEDDLIHRMRQGEFPPGAPRLLRYGVSADEAHRFGLPCGGTLELVLEPAPDAATLGELEQRIEGGRITGRCLDMASGRAGLHDAGAQPNMRWDGHELFTVHGPRWRLLLIGAGQLSACLAPMAMALGYRVIVCDPRREYTDAWRVDGVELAHTMPDDTVIELGLDARSAVVALTHDPKLDDMALLEALKSPAFYVGALGSRANNQRRRERLHQHFALTTAELDRLHGPVGLPIGSRTPAEIAISVLAEMTAVKNGLASPAPAHPQPAVQGAGCAAG